MSTPRKKKPARMGEPQKTTYSHILGYPLRLVNRTEPATQENQPSNTAHPTEVAGGRRSTDKDTFDLFLCWESLSPREQDVTMLVCQGLGDAEIARWLALSISTVKSYLQTVFLKTYVRNRRQLILKFMYFNFRRDLPPRR
jgi:DNA-binding CsgD family transcriptional regulator